MKNLDFYLSSATGYANQATSIFNMFITVMFSSFAFSRALPLKEVGSKLDLSIFTVSTSSLFVGASLFAFYVISFISFNESSKKAEMLIDEIHAATIENNLPPKIVSAFKLSKVRVFGLGLPSFGFIIGASVSLILFIWLTNY